jgi:hypothetical protein
MEFFFFFFLKLVMANKREKATGEKLNVITQGEAIQMFRGCDGKSPRIHSICFTQNHIKVGACHELKKTVLE